MNPVPPRRPSAGEPLVKRSHNLSLVWLVPLLAAAIGLWMLAHAWLTAGPEITISFRTASGLEAGKTVVKYKDVNVGTVTSLNLSDDGTHVDVHVALANSAQRLTHKDTRFWVVRPRIGASGVSGIDTLLSGAYIAADTGTAQESAKTFTGLEMPPAIIADMPGRSFILRADDLGSLEIGSPVYYRRVAVGRVASYKLAEDGRSVELQVFVDAPYDRFVTSNTRFWNASGINVSLNAEGFRVKTESVATLVAGGIAFGTPPYGTSAEATEQTEFTLARDQETAMAPDENPSQYLQLRFDRSLHGLAIGAPVQFAGMDLGRVVSLELDYDPQTQRFPTVVGIVVFPQRLGHALSKLPKLNGDPTQRSAQFLQTMVARGLRAQALPGNLLTGQLYISLDFIPQAPKAAFDPKARPLTLPTVNGGFAQLQEQMAHIVSRIDKIPLEDIGKHLDASLTTLDKTLGQMHSQVLPETLRTMQQAQQTFIATQGMLADDAPLQQNLNQTLQEMQRSARSLRTLTDLLGRQPQSLLRGLPDDPAPAPRHGPTPATEAP